MKYQREGRVSSFASRDFVFSVVIGNSLIFCTNIQITFLTHLYILIQLGNQFNEQRLKALQT